MQRENMDWCEKHLCQDNRFIEVKCLLIASLFWVTNRRRDEEEREDDDGLTLGLKRALDY